MELEIQVKEAEARLAQVKADLAKGTEAPPAEAAKIQVLEAILLSLIASPQEDQPPTGTPDEAPPPAPPNEKGEEPPLPQRQRAERQGRPRTAP